MCLKQQIQERNKTRESKPHWHPESVPQFLGLAGEWKGVLAPGWKRNLHRDSAAWWSTARSLRPLWDPLDSGWVCRAKPTAHNWWSQLQLMGHGQGRKEIFLMETSPPAPSAVSHLNKQREGEEQPEWIMGVTALCCLRDILCPGLFLTSTLYRATDTL